MENGVVLVGAREDAHVAAMEDVLNERGHEPLVFDARSFPTDRQITLGVKPEDIRIDGELWSRPAAVYVRSLYQDPVGFGVDASQGMETDWRRTLMAFRERGTVLTSLMLRWGNAGVPMYNPPAASANITKPYQLSLLSAAGLPVPKTVWTNEPWRARAFCDSVEAVYKPVAGGSSTRRVTPSDLEDERLSRLAAAPVCFQELLPGEDIRVYVIDGRVEVALKIVTDALDFRGSEQRIDRIELPARVAEQCVEATRVLGLRWTGMDLKRDRDGELKILELNPSAMFLGFDARSGSNIKEALATALLSHVT